MTHVEIVGGFLKIEMLGWDKLWAFKSQLDVPIHHVVRAQLWDRKHRKQFHGIRAPGTSLPGVIAAGTYHQREGGRWRHNFFAVHDFDRAILLELRDEWYHYVAVEVEDPEAVLKQVEKVVPFDSSTNSAIGGSQMVNAVKL